MLSVIMITYGHELFIEEALKGVFMQNTDFPLELIIANDCSPDQTDALIKRIISEAPDHIEVKYTKHEKNKGMMPNFIWAIQQARGKYIALCEGDDYWIDKEKLQKQFNFLEKNEDYSLIYHRVKYLIQNEEVLLQHHQNKTSEQTFSLEQLSQINSVNTPSVLFRNNVVNFHSQVFGDKIGDYPLWLLLAEKGKVKFIPDISAVYRYGTGVHSSLSKVKNLEVTNEMLSLLSSHFRNNSGVYQNLQKQISRNIQNLSYYKRRNHQFYGPFLKLYESFTYYKNKLLI